LSREVSIHRRRFIKLAVGFFLLRECELCQHCHLTAPVTQSLQLGDPTPGAPNAIVRLGVVGLEKDGSPGPPRLISFEPDDVYLSQSMTEDLVDLLSAVPELRVRPRGDTSRARATDAREIGRELDVDVVVEGSLRRTGDHVRISLRVITVEDGFQLWARRFERQPGEVLSIADEAASAIAHALAAERTAGVCTTPAPAGVQRALSDFLFEYVLNHAR